MSTSAVPGTLTYLVSTFTAAATIGKATPPVTVIFGSNTVNEWPQLALFVGCDDPNADPFMTGATSTQEWVGPGNRKRNEHLSIRCCAQVWTGNANPDVSAVITTAYGIVSAVEDLTRVDANLGGNVLFTEPGVTNLELRHGFYKEGPMAQVLFSIDCFARIGS